MASKPYLYKKKASTSRDRAILFKAEQVETVDEWKTRIEGYGIDRSQIAEFLEVRSHDKFMKYLADNLEIEDLPFNINGQE